MWGGSLGFSRSGKVVVLLNRFNFVMCLFGLCKVSVWECLDLNAALMPLYENDIESKVYFGLPGVGSRVFCSYSGGFCKIGRLL